MGLMERIFFRGWPTPLESGSPPDFSLDLLIGALGPFHLNASAEKLRDRLGAPANWRRWKKKREWYYPELGVWFSSSKEGAIDGINLIVREDATYHIFSGWMERLKTWSGSIRFPSGDTLPASSAKLDDFIKLAGDPDDRYDDNDEHELYYCEEPRFTTFGFDVDFTKDGDLSKVDLYSQKP